MNSNRESAAIEINSTGLKNGSLGSDLTTTGLSFHVADILERVTDAFLILDRDWKIVYANSRACEINRKPLNEFLGKTHWDEWPASVGSELERQYRTAMETQNDVHFEHRYSDGNHNVWLEIDAYPTQSDLHIFYRDITSRVAAAEKLQRSQEDLQLALDAARLGTFYADWPLDKIIWNETCRSHFFVESDVEVDIQLFYSLLHPEDRLATRRAVEQAMSERSLYDVEYRTVAADGRVRWVNAVGRVYYGQDGAPIRFCGITRDISTRKSALLRLEATNKRTAGILESITDAFYTLDREWCFTFVNTEAERVLRRSRQELIGKCLWDVYPLSLSTRFEYEFRRALAEDVTIYLEEYSKSLNTWLDVRAYPSPDGLSVFFQDITDRKQVETEREHLLKEQQARAEREALLNKVGQALRSLDPEAVQAAVVELLGIALGADRCYFAIYDIKNTVVTVSGEWRRDGLSPIAGTYPFSNTAEMFAELYRDTNRSVIRDRLTASVSEQTKANMESLDLRSRISIALVDSDGLMATLTAAMTDSPRDWIEDELDLVESVALELRSAIAMARVAQREHNIAMQLQDALQPELPEVIAGLELTRYYRPALAQSEGVGGDFYDVFTTKEGHTAIVVGDLSGKGLAAAAQVSTVRNMLRAFLYSLPSVRDAVTELNKTLASNSLISGFATLFVAEFNSSNGVLRYVNCGQDAGLIRRAGRGSVECLSATGAALGAISDACYEEKYTVLTSGDILAIYTDGLTEVGPSRKVLLGSEGVTTLLERAANETSEENLHELALSVLRRIIAGVDAFAESGARDDMCLLVGVVK